MKQTILLVEGNPNIIAVNKQALEFVGYRVKAAREIEQAKRIIKAALHRFRCT